MRWPLEDFNADVPRETIDYEGLLKVAPEGFWGKPTLASAEQGRAFYSLMLQKTHDYVDYALKLFDEGAAIGKHAADEIWWPQENIPGVEGGGLDWHNTLAGIAEADPELVIIPTAATEQHSPSQPLSTDYLRALELSRRLADELGAYLLPAMPIVTSWGHIRFRGSIPIGAMTVRRVLEDIAASLVAGGLNKAAIVNTHGGNWVVKPTMIEINQKYEGFKLISTGDILILPGSNAG